MAVELAEAQARDPVAGDRLTATGVAASLAQAARAWRFRTCPGSKTARGPLMTRASAGRPTRAELPGWPRQTLLHSGFMITGFMIAVFSQSWRLRKYRSNRTRWHQQRARRP
jgi:hypothetical protein